MFSKGFLDDLGKNKTPDYFWDSCLNVRIKNWWITVRNGQYDVYDADESKPIRWINTNTINSSDRLYYCCDSSFRYYDTVTETSTSIGSIGTDNTVQFINSGKYQIILTGAWQPYYYDWSVLTQTTSWQLTANVNPEFGTIFAWAIFINSKLNPETFYVSAPITLANPLNCVNWISGWGQPIYAESELKAFATTMNAVFVFTQDWIKRFDKSNLDTTGWAASLFVVPFIGKYSPPANHRCATAAWQVVFYLSEWKKIGTINYKATVTEPQASIISNIPWASIDWRMQRELHDDMDQNRVEYDYIRDLVKFHVRTRRSTVPDTVIIYDIPNQTFLVDDNKYTSCSTRLWDKLYAGSAFWHQIILDEEWKDDLWDPINRSFETTDVVIGWPDTLKIFNWLSTAGQINSLTTINRKVLIDENQALNLDIVWSSKTWVNSNGIGSSPIWWEPIWGYSTWVIDNIVDFESIIDYSRLRYTGKKIKSIFSWWQVWADFILDFYKVLYVPRARQNRADKYFGNRRITRFLVDTDWNYITNNLGYYITLKWI